MSKRFGRQQKKKMLQRIELQEFSYKMLSKEILDQRSTVNSAKEIVKIACRINPHTVAVPPVHTRYNHDFYTHRGIDPFVRLDGTMKAEPVDIRRVQLFELETTLRHDEFTNAVHVHTQIGDNRAAYRISREGLKYVSVDQIAMELAKHLKGIS